MWSSGPASHGQFSGNGCREQVTTRQPAAENRFTVAWPMPRLAPVRSSVRRGWLFVGINFSNRNELRVEPRLGPRRAHAVAGKGDAVVQPERPLLPELDLGRHDPIADPMRRPRYRADCKFGGKARNRLFEGEPALQRRRLL